MRTPEPPDSPTAAAARDLAAEVSPPYLLAHLERTYRFGRLLVTEDLDEEVAWVAAMLHDLGLTDAHRGDRSFELVGADAARQLLEQRSWDTDRIALVEQAIVRHVELAPLEQPELRLVQAGAALDVAGIPREWCDHPDVREIVAEHPRDGLVPALRAAYLAEIERQPTGAFAHLEAAVRLSEVMCANPLDHGAPQGRR